MPLEALKQLDQKQAAEVLAATALLASSPEPKGVVEERFRSDVDKVLSEVRNRLKIKPGDVSSKATRAIYDVLSRELDRYLLGGFDPGAVVGRLGQSGELPLGAYNLKATKQFKDSKENFEFASRCVRSAESFEHLSSAYDHLALEGVDPGTKAFSLFAKRVIGDNNRKPHWVLIETIRSENTLMIDALWRIFDQSVDLSEVSRPLDMLSALANEYGFEQRVPGTDVRGKFIYDVLVKVNGDEFDMVIDNQDRPIKGMQILRKVSADQVLVLAAYALDFARYKADILKLA